MAQRTLALQRFLAMKSDQKRAQLQVRWKCCFFRRNINASREKKRPNQSDSCFLEVETAKKHASKLVIKMVCSWRGCFLEAKTAKKYANKLVRKMACSWRGCFLEVKTAKKYASKFVTKMACGWRGYVSWK